jgi:ATP-dependent DNA helicase PIF1
MTLPKEYDYLIMHPELEQALNLLTETDSNLCIIGAGGCLTGDTIVRVSRAYKGFEISLAELYEKFNHVKGKWNTSLHTYACSYDEENKQVKLNKIKNVIKSGVKPIFKLILENGVQLKGTYNHRIMTIDGWKELGLLTSEDTVLLDFTAKWERTSGICTECKVKAVLNINAQDMTYDIECEAPHHSFVANNIVVHNSGKTEFIKLCSDKRVYNHNTIVCTPTGVSAVNASTEGVRATTIHSLFKLPPLSIIPPENLIAHGNLRDVFANLHTLIIDEVSMVNSDLLAKVVYLLNEYRRGNPVRIILIGDPSQLSPIIRSADEKDYIEDIYGSEFFFHSDIFSSMKIMHFTKIFRQKDTDFTDVLSRFRLHKATDDDFEYINSRVADISTFKKGGDFVYVALTNKTVNDINTRELVENTNPCHRYYGMNTYFPAHEIPVPEVLELKKGAQVMVCANNHMVGYYNGLIGHVKELHKNDVVIQSAHGEFTITPNKWSHYKYSYEESTKKITADISGSYTQLPLKIAYALTSHKTQGLTLDRMYVDLERGCFSSGMLYTILSRVRSLDGLGLLRPVHKKDNRLNMHVKKFYRRIM